MRVVEMIGAPGVGKSTIARLAIAAAPDLLCEPPAATSASATTASCLVALDAVIADKQGRTRLKRAAGVVNRMLSMREASHMRTAIVDAGMAQNGLALALSNPPSGLIDSYFMEMPAPDAVALVTAPRNVVAERNSARAANGGRDLAHMYDALEPLARRAADMFRSRGIAVDVIDATQPVLMSAQRLRDFVNPTMLSMKSLEQDYRMDGGFLWPSADPKAPRLSRVTVDDIAVAVEHCRGRRVVVQAGGNCGVWPRRMAGMFETVYTFEPDARNFVALSVNTADCHNVVRIQAALGDAHDLVELERNTVNCGAHYIDGRGSIPVMRIDDLPLATCDLIYLDIEGYEFKAFRGAERTIAQHRPVVAFEDKGLSDRYGTAQGDIEAWMAQTFNYRVAERVRKDVVMVPT